MGVVMRTDRNPEAVTAALRREIHALDPSVEPSTVESMEEYIQPAFEPVRVAATLLGILGVTALVLASLGLYGVMAYLVAQRSQEIGIRMALGAKPRDVFKLILGQGMALVLIGTGVGIAAALGLTHLLASLLYGVSATDPLTFITIPILLMAVALVACYLPARSAMRVDPINALRHQ
jgi:putative ABC transport system permease protein